MFDKINDLEDVRRSPLLKCDENHWPMIGSLLGCDCSKRIPSFGFSTTFEKTLPNVESWDADATVSAIENTTSCHVLEECRANRDQAVNSLRHAPVSNEDNILVPINEGHVNSE